MKYISTLGILLLTGLASSTALADCVADGYTIAGTQADLSGKQILAVSPTGEDWKEDHCSSGDLYKLGDGTAVDPYAFRGTWTFANGAVTYSYSVGGNSSYTWGLWTNATTGGLCWDSGGTIIATATAPGAAGACSVGVPL